MPELVMPKTKRELIRAIDNAWDDYVRFLETETRKLGKSPGDDIGGLTAMAEFIGRDKANVAYGRFQLEQMRLGEAYSDYVTAPLIAAEHARKAIEAKAARLREAQRHVTYYEELLEREKVRAVAVVKYANFTEAEAKAIIDDAEEKLADAQAELEDLQSEAAETEATRDDRILAAMRTYKGKINRNKYPVTRALRDHAGMPGISNEEKRRLWAQLTKE